MERVRRRPPWMASFSASRTIASMCRFIPDRAPKTPSGAGDGDPGSVHRLPCTDGLLRRQPGGGFGVVLSGASAGGGVWLALRVLAVGAPRGAETSHTHAIRAPTAAESRAPHPRHPRRGARLP